MSQVASHASIIHSQNHAFTGRSRPAADAQQPASPFSLLLDDAGGAPPLPAKTPCELPQASQTALPQTPEQAVPEQQIASATLPLLVPFPESEKAAETAKAAAEVAIVAPLDQNQGDTTDPADPSAITAVLIDATAPLLPPQQPPAAVMIAPLQPLQMQSASEQPAEESVTAAAPALEVQSSPEQPLPTGVTPSSTVSQTQPGLNAPGPAVSAPATLSQAQADLEGGTPASVSATVTSLKQASAPEPAAKATDTAPVSSAEPQAQPQQPIATAAAAVTVPAPSAPEPQQTSVPAVSSDSSQPQLISGETAEPEAAVVEDAPTPGAASPKGASRSPVAADRSQITGLPNPIGPGTNGLQTAAAAQALNKGHGANTEQKNAAQSANAGSPDEGEADPIAAANKEHVAIVPTAARVGTPSSESSSTPRAEAHAGETRALGPTPEGVQLINLQHPAERFAAPALPAAPQSSHDVAAAAVPLAALAIEIAARAKTEGNRFEIRLDPPELGRVDVRLDIDRSGQVTSRLLVDRVETLDALRRDAGDLERALQQAGLKTADNGLQFALRDQSFAGRDHSLPTAGAARVVVPASDLPAIDVVQAGYGRVLRPGGGIDIRV